MRVLILAKFVTKFLWSFISHSWQLIRHFILFHTLWKNQWEKEKKRNKVGGKMWALEFFSSPKKSSSLKLMKLMSIHTQALGWKFFLSSFDSLSLSSTNSLALQRTRKRKKVRRSCVLLVHIWLEVERENEFSTLASSSLVLFSTLFSPFSLTPL